VDRPLVTAARDERRSPTPAAVHKRDAIRRLKEALAADRFVLHYQPIVDAHDAQRRFQRGGPENLAEACERAGGVAGRAA